MPSRRRLGSEVVETGLRVEGDPRLDVLLVALYLDQLLTLHLPLQAGTKPVPDRASLAVNQALIGKSKFQDLYLKNLSLNLSHQPNTLILFFLKNI